MSAPPAFRINATTSAISALSMAMTTSAASNPRAFAPGASFPRARLVVADWRVVFDLFFAVAMRRDSTPCGSLASTSGEGPGSLTDLLEEYKTICGNHRIDLAVVYLQCGSTIADIAPSVKGSVAVEDLLPSARGKPPGVCPNHIAIREGSIVQTGDDKEVLLWSCARECDDTVVVVTVNHINRARPRGRQSGNESDQRLIERAQRSSASGPLPDESHLIRARYSVSKVFRSAYFYTHKEHERSRG